MDKRVDIDAEGLAAEILGISEDDTSFHEELHERFGCDMMQFEDLVSHLVALIDVGSSPLTGTRFKGFSKNGLWLAKIAIAQQPAQTKEV